jgi:perosamine synthetase
MAFKDSIEFIPVSEPVFGIEEQENVVECLKTGWVSSEGSYVKEFEDRCATYCDSRFGIAVSSGTTALQVALQCLELEKGDEVILPSFTIISCVIAVLEAGGKPVLIDCTPDTWTMHVDQIENKITKKTKAIMAVHIYGHPVQMDNLFELAEKYSLAIIEDAAEAHGANYRDRKCGGLGDIGILSFYANKLVTTGEGGMLLTNCPEYASRARSFRNMCFLAEERFLHKSIGHNYRLSNIQAAVGVAQVGRLDKFVSRKREMARRYMEKLKDLPVILPVEKPWAKNIYWMFGVVLDDSVDQSKKIITANLLAKGVETRSFFRGMHEQPVLKELGLFSNESYPVTEKIFRRGFYLPSGQALSDSQIDTVCEIMCEEFRA